MNQDVGTRVKELRLAKGWSQKELAAAAQVQQSAVSDVELGKRPNVSVYIIDNIAKALGVTVDYLLHGIQSRKSKNQSENGKK